MNKFYTSYYANIKNIPEEYITVSISGDIPEYINTEVDVWDKRLAPNWSLFKEYKESHEGLTRELQYVKRFKKEILSNIDLNEIINSWNNELKMDKTYVILCYETPEEFCHRQIVAEAIEQKYKIEVPELSISDDYERKNYKYIPKIKFNEFEW